jgi:cyanophycin synthetase
MIKILENPALLTHLSYLDRVRRFLLYRNKGRLISERNHAAFYERIWGEAARFAGGIAEPLGDGFIQIRLDDFETKVLNQRSALDNMVTCLLARTKTLAYRLLEKQALPLPQHAVFSLQEIEKAVEFMRTRARECVVKPASDTAGGLGVTTRIRSRRQLIRAAAQAARFGPEMIIEEQVEGDNYRLLYLDGHLLDAVLRVAPTIKGDGNCTIRQLIRQENHARLMDDNLSHTLVTLDADMQHTLASQGFSLNSVPGKGAVVTLKTATNENRAADNTAASDLLSDEIIRDGARAARALGVRLSGVDIITKDPRLPLARSGGVILEVNPHPGFFWHYHRRGEPFAVARHVLETLLNEHRASGAKLSELQREALTVV